MSNQSLADTLAGPKKVEKGIVAPPHFGDIGKAANDTFSKVLINAYPANFRTFPSQVLISIHFTNYGVN